MEPFGPGPSTAAVKESRKRFGPGCSTCNKSGGSNELKKCEACKSTRYCSKKCQKENWPEHKFVCRDIRTSAQVSKKITTLISNQLLSKHIQRIIVAGYDIASHPEMVRLPFMVHFDYVVEPSHLEDLNSLRENEDLLDAKLEGMIQLTRVTFDPIGAPLPPQSQLIWQQFRDKTDLKGWIGYPVGIVNFTGHGSTQCLSWPSLITPYIMEDVKRGGMLPVPGEGGFHVMTPRSADDYLEYLNLCIRFDTNNRWLLRINMRHSDKSIMLDDDATRNLPGAQYFREKIQREYVYTEDFRKQQDSLGEEPDIRELRSGRWDKNQIKDADYAVRRAAY